MALGRTRLIASCQAVAEAPGTVRRWCLQVQRQTRLEAWQLGSHSPRSWWLWQARQRMGTGRRRLEGTGHRLGCLVYTQGRARTVTGQGWQVSPRWAAQWLAGRCSAESACGPSRVSGAVGRKEHDGGRVGEAKGLGSKGTVLCPSITPSTRQFQQHARCTLTPGSLHGQCYCFTHHQTSVLSVLLLNLGPPRISRNTHCTVFKRTTFV